MLDSFSPDHRPKGLKVYPLSWVILGMSLVLFLQAVWQHGAPKSDTTQLPDQVDVKQITKTSVQATPEGLANQALHSYRTKDYDTAEQLARKASHLEQSSTRRKSLLAFTDYILGLCEAHKGNIPSAISRLKNSCRLEPSDKEYRKTLALLRAYYAKQQRIMAEQTLVRLSSLLENTNPEPTEIQAVIGETAAVMAKFRQHGGNNQQMARTLMIKSWALAINGQGHEALKVLRKARRLNDNRAARDIERVLLTQIQAAEARPSNTLLETPYDAQISAYDEQGSDAVVSDVVQDNSGEDYSVESTDDAESNESSYPVNADPPDVAENGDIQGVDNDLDGRVETVFVRGYRKSDGTYVRSHYRARPR